MSPGDSDFTRSSPLASCAVRLTASTRFGCPLSDQLVAQIPRVAVLLEFLQDFSLECGKQNQRVFQHDTPWTIDVGHHLMARVNAGLVEHSGWERRPPLGVEAQTLSRR